MGCKVKILKYNIQYQIKLDGLKLGANIKYPGIWDMTKYEITTDPLLYNKLIPC